MGKNGQRGELFVVGSFETQLGYQKQYTMVDERFVAWAKDLPGQDEVWDSVVAPVFGQMVIAHRIEFLHRLRGIEQTVLTDQMVKHLQTVYPTNPLVGNRDGLFPAKELRERFFGAEVGAWARAFLNNIVREQRGVTLDLVPDKVCLWEVEGEHQVKQANYCW